ncbi:B3 domain-containing protein [Capsicum chacoense]|uniref:B3 domain-containing protein n=1 Tax=Capsicum annuum TaxID=4072 RepID=A0A1U8E8F3_CAPAN|nr:B3 domain-containing protein At3g19184 [Capsicum annuum]KAF3636543.1 B3 domain-containing protein [Capsicum annuum]KAF3666256.1 B3 domain-containing protein [Capsicum annuum]PHT63118.1 B3 domain-containing protein [Capsicum annuum]
MVESKKKMLTYEESRLKRLEENKKRMEELNLTKLAQAVRSATSPKPSPMKKVKPRVRQEVDLSSVRRSNRVADKPAPNYREAVIEPLGRPRSYRRRDLLNRVYAADEDRQYAIERAEQLQSEFDADFPSFVKPMLQSHVTGGFWLGLPVHFCKTHLPKHDEYVTLIDENGDEAETKYLALKTGLSGGWRGFAIDHELVDGDALVFQLIAPTRFKVYIIRVNQAEDEETEGVDNVI